MQWSDLVSALHYLGYRFTFETKAYPNVSLDQYDLVFLDYQAASHFFHGEFGENSCKIRILDVFGTQEVIFKRISRSFQRENRRDRNETHIDMYCCLNLNLGQFLTYIPDYAPGNLKNERY